MVKLIVLLSAVKHTDCGTERSTSHIVYTPIKVRDCCVCVCVPTSAASCLQVNTSHTRLWEFYMKSNTLASLWWILAAGFVLLELPDRTLNAPSVHVRQELVFTEGNKTPAAGVLLLPTGCPAAAAVRLPARSCWTVKPAHIYNMNTRHTAAEK